MSYTRNTTRTQNVVARIQRAISLHGSGRLSAAEAIYNEVLQAQPDHFDATHLLGVIAMQRGQNERAVEQLSNAVSLRADHPHARTNLGNALLRAGRHDEALRQYEHALRLDSGLKGALNNYGNALQSLGRYEEAAAALGRLAELDPMFDYAAGASFQSRRHCADWADYTRHVHTGTSSR